jgi:hypothetical protein
MRYVVDLRHPLKPLAPYGELIRSLSFEYDFVAEALGMWECGNPEGISERSGKGGKPAFWLSRLSIPRHFQGLPAAPVSRET